MNEKQSEKNGPDRRCGKDRRSLWSPGLPDFERRNGRERRELIDRRKQMTHSATYEERLDSNLLKCMIKNGVKGDCKQNGKLRLIWKK